jgi:hypothetical protein
VRIIIVFFIFSAFAFPVFSQDETGYGDVKWGMSVDSFLKIYQRAVEMSSSRERVKIYRIDPDRQLSVQFFFFDDQFFEVINIYSSVSANNAINLIDSVEKQFGKFDSKDEGNNMFFGHAYNYYREYSSKMKIEATIYEGRTISTLIRLIHPPIYKEMQKIYPDY